MREKFLDSLEIKGYIATEGEKNEDFRKNLPGEKTWMDVSYSSGDVLLYTRFFLSSFTPSIDRSHYILDIDIRLLPSGVYSFQVVYPLRTPFPSGSQSGLFISEVLGVMGPFGLTFADVLPTLNFSSHEIAIHFSDLI